MHAVLIQAPDGADAFAVADRPVRAPEAGEVLLRVLAAAVNPADVMMWRTLGGGSVEVPFTAGMDAAGLVEAVGPGVEGLHAGQRVMAVVFPRRPEGGAQAELVIVPAASVVPIADDLDLVDASTVPMNGLTALAALALLDLPAGSTLAVTGAAGQLASLAIPLAARAGLTVIADAKPDDVELVRSFGADLVVPRSDDFSAAVRAVVPGGVDAVLDTATVTRTALGAIRDGGAIAVLRGWEGSEPERGIRVERVSVGVALQNTAWLRGLAADAADGVLPLRVAGTVPAAEAESAYLRTEAGGLRGRLVITFG
ncbi:NADP-dependent oxidoreductase [Herbiconiux sp. 11R-BC]|uniref:quinone oxidoreductase family protein n=1 Tax=Herbiconiux sp. 11R-BC TaxID=3111637 RepID=UPI003C0769BB